MDDSGAFTIGYFSAALRAHANNLGLTEVAFCCASGRCFRTFNLTGVHPGSSQQIEVFRMRHCPEMSEFKRITLENHRGYLTP